MTEKSFTWKKCFSIIRGRTIIFFFKYSVEVTAVVITDCSHDVEGMPEIQTFHNDEISTDELVSRLSKNMGVPILNDGRNQAFYSPREDTIHLPEASAFLNTYAYNATALHELSHSTGHPTRLNRPQGGFFGSEGYAYEELVAEMCSCFMGAELTAEATPEHIENHKTYVQSWVQEIRDKPDSLIRAIRDAQAATNYMDLKADLITEQEYEKTLGETVEMNSVRAKGLER